jgi:type VI secretion system protein VasI
MKFKLFYLVVSLLSVVLAPVKVMAQEPEVQATRAQEIKAQETKSQEIKFQEIKSQETKADLLVQQAGQCREVKERLERLRCFDRVFKTPVERMHVIQRVRQQAPVSWIRAFDAADKTRQGEVMHVVSQGNGAAGDAWLTLIASNDTSRFEKGQKPILMMSCIHNISRIDLAFPKAIPDARVKLSIGHSAQYWRSDDSGLLLSSGRGIPAIGLMKEMIKHRQIVLRSNSASVDGLLFDTSQLSDGLVPLRKRCGW